MVWIGEENGENAEDELASAGASAERRMQHIISSFIN